MSMTPVRTEPPATGDLDRLRAEYADRRARLAGSDLYSYFNPAHLFMVQQRQRLTLRLLRRAGFFPLSDYRLLEVGCGWGEKLGEYLTFQAAPSNLHGIELLPEDVATAHSWLPHLPLSCADGQALPYASGVFDVVMQHTMFSSVLDGDIRRNVAREMVRVLRPGGVILWYDFWLNPTNPHTRGVRPAEMRALFPGSRISLHRVTLAPPLARRIVPLSWTLALLLENLRLLNTHYLALIRR